MSSTSHQNAASLFLMLWLANLTTVGLMTVAMFYIVLQNSEMVVPAATTFFGNPLVLAAYVVGLGLLVAAKFVPKLIYKQSPAELLTNGPIPMGVKVSLMLPYVLRLCLMEGCGVIGFLVSIFEGDVSTGAPLMAISLLFVLGSIPSDRLLRKMILGPQV